MGYWKRWVLQGTETWTYRGVSSTSYDQLVRVITSGDCARIVNPTCSPSQPNFSPPPPLSWALRPHKRHVSNHPFFCSIEQPKCISRYQWVSSSICESLRETSSFATFQQRVQGVRRFYSVVVEDARSITFDGDTSLRRGFLGQKSGRRASWGVLGATAKECRHSSHINLPSVLMRQHHRVRAPTINTVDCYQNIQWGPAAKKYSVKKGRLRLWKK